MIVVTGGFFITLGHALGIVRGIASGLVVVGMLQCIPTTTSPDAYQCIDAYHPTLLLG
jgi:hypothetical protein